MKLNPELSCKLSKAGESMFSDARFNILFESILLFTKRNFSVSTSNLLESCAIFSKQTLSDTETKMSKFLYISKIALMDGNLRQYSSHILLCKYIAFLPCSENANTDAQRSEEHKSE